MPAGVLVSFAEVVAQIADGRADGDFAISIGPSDITERDHLFQCFVGRHGIEPRMGRMAAVRAGDFLPTRNERCLRRFQERLRNHLAIHIFAYGQSVERQDGGRDV